MPYQEVKKPAFYLPILDYMNGTGGLWNPSNDTDYYYTYRNAGLRSMHLLNPEKVALILVASLLGKSVADIFFILLAI